MATRPGLIIYNLQDYQQSGGRISTSGANVFSTIVDTDPGYKNNRINIYENLVSHYNVQGFTKLGILAAPGTLFILNKTKGMIVGRSGIYELDDDIIITELEFVKPRYYRLDDKATQDKLDNGSQAISAAEKTRSDALKTLDELYELRDLLTSEAELSEDGTKYIYPNKIYDDWKNKEPQFFTTYSDNEDGTFSVDKDSIDSALILFNKDYWTKYTDIQSAYQDAYDPAYADLNLGLNGVYEIDNTVEGDLENVIVDFLY